MGAERFTRRDFLITITKGTGVAAIGGILAGCNENTPTTKTVTTDLPTAVTATPSSTPTVELTQ